MCEGVSTSPGIVTQNTQNPPACGPSVGAGGGFEDIEYGSGGCGKLLADLRASGVVLSIEGDGLAFDAPEGVLTDELLGRMRAHREELLALIEIEVAGSSSDDLAPGGSSVPSSIVCPWCRSADLVDEPEGIRCRGCDRLAWLDLPGGKEQERLPLSGGTHHARPSLSAEALADTIWGGYLSGCLPCANDRPR